MTTPDDREWQNVEQDWRALQNVRGGADSSGANLARAHARARWLFAAQLLVSAGMLWLAFEALREHPGTLSTLLGVLFVLHIACIWLVGAWNRGTINRLLVMDTRTFLDGWLGAHRRQLVTIRVLVCVLVAEGFALGYWLTGRLATNGGTLVTGEVMWLGLVAVVLGSAAWIFVVRARALEALTRVVATRSDLDAR